MKAKFGILVCVMLALASLPESNALTGASVWEGAVSVSPGGLFPETGYFVATNSFPRNTIVDITNLENEKTIRVIVVTGLETPGLLALVSRDAAASIGLSDSSIGRIRMSQPADPIAFSRFTGGLAAEGFSVSGLGGGTDPEGGYLSAFSDSEDNLDTDTSLAENDSASSAESLPDPLAVYDSEGEGETEAEPAITELVEAPEYSRPETPGDSSYTTSPDEPVLAENPAPVVVSAAPASPLEPFTPASDIVYDYSLVAAEERPPEYSSAYTIDPDSIIPGISGKPAEALSPAEDSFLPAEYIVPGASALSETVPPLFSIPLISSLERGRYYVQVGAYSKVETVEAEVQRLGSAYPLAVFNAGSGGSPVYRVLLGPLNLGESGAVLKRFKSIGYRDAFVRSGS